MKQFQFLRIIWVVLLAGIVFPSQAQFFDPDSAVLVDPPPATGTFIGIYGNFAPLPFCPDGLEIYSCGVSDQFWVNDLDYGFGFGLRSLADAVPDPSGGGTNGYGSDGYTNSYNLPVYSYTSGDQYYSNFWLMVSASPTNSQVGLITLENTLAGNYYNVLTNGDLNTTTWGLLTTVLASSTNTPVPPVDMSSLQHLAYRGQIVFPHGTYLTNGLVAYWPLHESQGITAADTSGSNNTLSLSNSPYWGPGYVILNGTNQYGDAGTNAAEITNQDMSICAWVNQTSNVYKGIVDKSFATPFISGGWGLRAGSDGHVSFHAVDFCIDDGPAIVVPNQWTFVTAVWHNSARSTDFYYNGLYNTTKPSSSADLNSTKGLADVLVGSFQDNASDGLYCFNGSIRDVAVYSNALTANQVLSNFFSTEYVTNVSVPDVLYYKMTEYGPSNATIPTFPLYDSSSHGGTTGTYYNSSETWTTNQAGLSNTALHFGGYGAIVYLDTSNSVLFNFTTNSFTINLWLQPLTPGGYLMGNWDGNTNGWYLAEGGSYQIIFGGGAGQYIITPNPISGWPSLYRMITIVRNGNNSPLLYVDGQLTPTTGSLSTIFSSTRSLVFGLPPTGTNEYDGNIWQPQIWTNALTGRDIVNLYFNQLSGMPWL